ncbi:MAG TPA: hypothetical protein PLJ11_06265 [Methanomassiliicoccales archaeon]|nr:hypothetical protein [Methanomassiliicoccales archaeon]
MTSKVRVRMFPCDNVSTVEARSTDDGDFELKVSSTCPKVERFVSTLSPLSLADLTDKASSKVFQEFMASDMSANCLTPSAVLTAAWVEAGMIARSNARKGIPLMIEFVND